MTIVLHMSQHPTVATKPTPPVQLTTEKPQPQPGVQPSPQHMTVEKHEFERPVPVVPAGELPHNSRRRLSMLSLRGPLPMQIRSGNPLAFLRRKSKPSSPLQSL
jgi:hypothetical protein